jgi:hypothetical protein
MTAPMHKAFGALATALAALMIPATAPAALQIKSFDFAMTNADGTPSQQAGGHPFQVTTSFTFPTHIDAGNELPDESVRNLSVDLPAGFVGNPTATPTCGEHDLVTGSCSASTQVGYVNLISPSSGLPPMEFPVYNMKPPEGIPALFGFYPLNVAVHMEAKIRSDSDYGVTVVVKDLPQTLAWTATSVTFWGVPADPSHDGLRGDASHGGCLSPFGPIGATCPSQVPRTAFLTNPSACSAASVAFARADSWPASGVFATAQATNVDGGGHPAAIVGCDRLPFDPTITARPTVATAGSPAGFSVRLHVPQVDNPDGTAEATLKKAVVTLPAGVSVSPSSADGLGACSPAQIGLHDGKLPSCPDSAKIGSVTVDTPLLNDPLTGSIYLAQQGSNPFNSLLAIYLVASGDGVVIKLAGHVEPDPVTGQLKTTFDNNPQLPFSDFTLSFKDGPRAALANPERCGTYTTSAELTPWGGGPAVTTTDSFTIDQGCTGGFAPSFEAGTTDPAGGAATSFTLNVARTDTEQELGTIGTVLPQGLLGNLKDITLCQEPAATAGTCDSASQVGTTTVGSGPGVSPFFLGGKVFLTGPYKGAPFGLSIAVPALAGPFDLGMVVVRAAITVDPKTAALTVTSDQLPSILQGIPLRLRKVNVTVNRPGFMFNPTNCAPAQIAGYLVSTAGTPATVASRFQAANCAALPYKPPLSSDLSGKGQTVDDKHPGLTAHLLPRLGDANTKKVTAVLPLSLALDPDNANGLCEPTDAAKNQCPAKSIVGSAKAVSILHEPLSAPVYFVRGERIDPKSHRTIKTLPKLYIPLTGEGVRIDVGASSEVIDDRLATTFDNLPDAPLRSFDLTINGGTHGILVVSGTDICKANQDMDVDFVGQNGRTATSVVPMGTPCSLGVRAASHTASALKLTVGGLGAGRVTVSGAGIVKTSRTLVGATVATLRPRFTAAVKRTLARHRDATIKVTVSFLPKGAKKARVSHKTLTVHG